MSGKGFATPLSKRGRRSRGRPRTFNMLTKAEQDRELSRLSRTGLLFQESGQKGGIGRLTEHQRYKVPMRSQKTASVQVIGKATHFMKETGILTVMVSIDHPELAAKLSEFMRRRSGFGLCSYHTLVTSPWGEDNPNVKREHVPDAAMCCIRPEYSFQLSNTVVVAEMSFLNKGKLINIEDAAGIQFEESDLAPSDFAHFSFASFMQVQSPEDLAHQAIVDSAKKFEMNVGYQSSTVISCTEFKDANDLRYQLVSRAKRFWVVCVALEPDQKTNSTMCYE